MINEILFGGLGLLLFFYWRKCIKKQQCKNLLNIWESRGEIDRVKRKDFEKMWNLKDGN